MSKKNHKATVSFDVHSADFRRAEMRLQELIDHLARAKSFEGRDQLLVELRAGQQYLKAPKAKYDLVVELIERPLRRLKKQPSTQQVGEIASEFLGWFSPILREAAQLP